MGGTQLRIIVPSVSLVLSQETQGGLLIQSIITILIILIKTIFVVVIVIIDIVIVVTAIISVPDVVQRDPGWITLLDHHHHHHCDCCPRGNIQE